MRLHGTASGKKTLFASLSGNVLPGEFIHAIVTAPTFADPASPIPLKISAIDSFGNLITNITSVMLIGRPTDRRACIICNIYETWGVYRAYAEQPRGTLIALIGSSGRLELALVGDSASRRLGIGVGSPVTVAWE